MRDGWKEEEMAGSSFHVMVTKCQVWARCCARCREYSGELDRQGPVLLRLTF